MVTLVAGYSSLHVLVVDDDAATRGLLESFLRSEGHTVTLAEDGARALSLFEKDRFFDLFIIDVTMPVMDGLTLCHTLIDRLEHWVPIMLISANLEEKDEVEGLGIGADYYITKPISFPLLRAKVQASQRIARLQRELEQSHEKLQDYYNTSQSDNDLAQELLDGILHQGQDKVMESHYKVNPAGDFSGDLFISVNSPSQRHYSLVADATGHGLPAAITLLPVVETFSRLARDGYSVETLAREVNSRLKNSLPRGRFVAATIIMIEAHTRRLEIWNGGNPTAYLIDDTNRTLVTRFPSQHPPLGILDEESFDARIQSYAYNPAFTLVSCTDGVVEAEAEDGRRFGAKGLIDVLTNGSRSTDVLAELYQTLERFTGLKQEDDQTVLVLPLNRVITDITTVDVKQNDVPEPLESTALQTSQGAWYLSVGVHGTCIQEAELAPLINGLIPQIGISGQDADRVHVCVMELINNAIDHGVLRLDSALKQSPEGFETYFNERHRRLQALNDGSIFIRVKLDHTDEQRVLRIAISDSGDGFTAFDQPAESESAGQICPIVPHGRGIGLVQRLADRLVFHDGGATAEFQISLAKSARGQ